MLTKLTIIIVINRFVLIVNFCNRFDKALTEIFQFCRALLTTISVSPSPSILLTVHYLLLFLTLSLPPSLSIYLCYTFSAPLSLSFSLSIQLSESLSHLYITLCNFSHTNIFFGLNYHTSHIRSFIFCSYVRACSFGSQ